MSGRRAMDAMGRADRVVVVVDKSAEGRHDAALLIEGAMGGALGRALSDWMAEDGEYAVIDLDGTTRECSVTPAADINALLDTVIPHLFGAAASRIGTMAVAVMTAPSVRERVERALGRAASPGEALALECPPGHVGICLSLGGGRHVAAMVPADALTEAMEAEMDRRPGGRPATADGRWRMATGITTEAAMAPTADHAVGPCLAAAWNALAQDDADHGRQGLRTALSSMMAAGRGTWLNIGIVDGRLAASCSTVAADMASVVDAGGKDEDDRARARPEGRLDS